MHHLKDMSFSERASTYDSSWVAKHAQKLYLLLINEIQIHENSTVLDVGCGTGTILKGLSDKCKINGFGIDAEEKMLEIARQKCPKIDFSIQRCDNTNFSNNTFDIIIASLAYHHFDNREGFAKEAGRIIKQGGILYIADPIFPWLLRKIINGFLSQIHMHGGFFSAKELETQFSKYGFKLTGTTVSGFKQVVKLEKQKEN